jgi:hypothetical protein
LLCVDASSTPKKWVVRTLSDLTHWELFDPTAAIIDTDAAAVFTAIEAVLTTNSLSTTLLTSTIRNAINARIIAKKANATWTSTTAYYGMVGGAVTTDSTAAQAIDSINFKSPGTFNITIWTGSFIRNAAGTAATADTGKANTGILVDKTNFPDAGNSMGFYNTSAITGFSNANIIAANNYGDHGFMDFGDSFRGKSYKGGDNDIAAASAHRSKGFKAVIRDGTTIRCIYNSTSVDRSPFTPSSDSNLGNFYLFSSANFNTANTSSYGAFWCGNTTWTLTQAETERTDETAYQTALSRN